MKCPRRAVHKHRAEFPLQPAQVTARHWQGESKRTCCMRDTSRLGDANERGQLLKHWESLLKRCGSASRVFFPSNNVSTASFDMRPTNRRCHESCDDIV